MENKMNTINYFNTTADYLKFINEWKKISSNKKATWADHILYCILKNQPLSIAFKPITNKVKLEHNCNGYEYYFLRTEFSHVSFVFSHDGKTFNTMNDWSTILTPETKTLLKAIFKANKFEKFVEGQLETPNVTPVPMVAEMQKPKSIFQKFLGGK